MPQMRIWIALGVLGGGIWTYAEHNAFPHTPPYPPPGFPRDVQTPFSQYPIFVPPTFCQTFQCLCAWEPTGFSREVSTMLPSQLVGDRHCSCAIRSRAVRVDMSAGSITKFKT